MFDSCGAFLTILSSGLTDCVAKQSAGVNEVTAKQALIRPSFSEVAVTSIVLSHRFVGPAYVMHNAVAKMREGDYTGRLSLREHDGHTVLAAELTKLRDGAKEDPNAGAADELNFGEVDDNP